MRFLGEGHINIEMELAPTSSAHGISNISPIMEFEFGIISPPLQDGWSAYLDMVCVDSIMKNELEDYLLQTLHKKYIFLEEKLFSEK